ncbi:MAG: polysaccharide biosynthesis/export family protein, partial [Flavobacteriaceae bacterium]|nr:polysaccharide biosynthesis/export family protein [Flavobacteriaceae bacterium]
MRSHLFTNTLLFFLVFSCLSVGLTAQTLPDFSSVDVASLSDQQIESYLKQAQAMGYSEEDLLTLAKSQGVSTAQLSLLNSRISSIRSLRVSQALGSPVESSRLRKPYMDSLEAVSKKETNIYGLSIFRKESFLSFQTNQNIPTPEDYILGAGDEVYIDVYGASESYYQAKLNPDGTIVLENIGPVS